MIPTLKLTLNPIFVLIIITHAQVFETIKKHGGQGYLAAPYHRGGQAAERVGLSPGNGKCQELFNGG